MQKDWKRLVDAAREQGWRIEETTNGWQLKAPNGVFIETIHGTPSDRRAIRNAIARMRRGGGFEWPPLRKKK